MGRKVFSFDGIEGVLAMPATSGTISLTNTNIVDVLTLTPLGACTINADAAQDGNILLIVITTSGTTSRAITFGTNFKASGNLATGTVNGKKFILKFLGMGELWYQIIRTAAL
jgi:hypothetical protein